MIDFLASLEQAKQPILKFASLEQAKQPILKLALSGFNPADMMKSLVTILPPFSIDSVHH